MHNTKEANIGRKTKVIEARITKTFTLYVTAEVPIDTSELDAELLDTISCILMDELPEPDDYDVCVSDSNDPPDYRLEKSGEKWRVIQLTYHDRARLRLADLHDQLIRSQKGSDDLEYNRVTIELSEGHLAPGCIYYRPGGYAVVIAAEDAGYRTGLLLGFDHCYPASTEALALPWNLVEVLDESSSTGVWNLFERAAEWLEDEDSPVIVERPFMTLITKTVRATPQRAVETGELRYRLDRSSDESDVTR